MEDQYYWWKIYGRFSPGEDNLPCIGEVIAYYLALSGLSKQELAHSLQWTERYIEMLKSPKNRDMPKSLPRRIMLAKVLHIPPVLLGLSSVTLMQWGTDVQAKQTMGQDVLVSQDKMSFYERLLSISWELYYTSSVQKAASSIEESFTLLEQESLHATGVQKDQYNAMRCRFLQLYSLVLRDRKDIDQALTTETDAIALALQLKNAELIAASLLRRARIYIQQKQYNLALEDALAALPYANLSRDPLKGKCYQMAGEAQGYVAAHDHKLQEKSLSYFRTAAKIARKGDLTPDGSFVKTDLTSVYIEQAEALTLWKRFDEAYHTLSLARKTLSPELTRWKINLLLAEAKLFLAQKDIDNCCHILLEVFPIIRAVSLLSKEEHIKSLCLKCKDLAPSNSYVLKLEKLLVTS